MHSLFLQKVNKQFDLLLVVILYSNKCLNINNSHHTLTHYVALESEKNHQVR